MILNYTPHDINIGDITIKSSGIARCETTTEDRGTLQGIPIVTTVFGEIVNLPEEVFGESADDDTYLIVSRLVASAVINANPYRQDILVPSQLVRDHQGKVIGCKALEPFKTS
jgi:hypothetical protein